MERPSGFSLPNLIKDDHSFHFLVLILTAVNTLLIIIIFFFPAVIPKFKIDITPVSDNEPTVIFSLISPPNNSKVAGNVPLVTTLTNGPQITGALLYVDGKLDQTLNSSENQKLTLYWDSTKVANGPHLLQITVTQNNKGSSTVLTNLNVQNKSSQRQGAK